MANFDFLKNTQEFNMFSEACIEAEKSIGTSPVLCALGVRKSAELAIKWLYSVDKNLKTPFKDNVSALLYNPSFSESIDDDIFGKLKFIIKLGNFAAHTNKSVTYKEATIALSNLFDFVSFIEYCYGTNYIEREFDEELLPNETNAVLAKADYDKLKDELDKKAEESEKLLSNLKLLQEELALVKEANTSARDFVSGHKTEAATRKHYIDVDIKAAGWVFKKDCREEVPVVGMPNGSGDGAVDYVLYGDNGKPLAVIEAKNTSVDPKVGRQQAKLYANCLEQMTGQRPLIFYTNGYNTWFWDDTNYPERKVFSVFTKEELQLIINRRETRRQLDQIAINPEITDRHYQKSAIMRVCEEFSKGRRMALLVMATGTGKTRTAVSLVDVLMSNGWVKNVLFLADRRELVKQAKRAFNKHMPNLSTCNLMERGEDKPTDRAIFSTYPTIMNAINEEKNEDGKKLFTPAHFDLIIIDEAHRSIFKKYRAIFEYFDALLVGLTATPKDEVERNTYDFFCLEDHMPTFAYEYNTAVSEKHLVDYHCIEKLFQVPTEGIHYDELNADEQLRLEEVFEEGEDVPDFISGDAINSQYFNIDTNRKVITDLMQKGLKVEGGDKLGKTIIFAKNHPHAQFIEKQFNELYPQYKGEFARVIDNYEKYSDDLLESFKVKDKYPQIAISVDMLDTGIDVPEVVNLVFFKRVLSKTKFWQMFGRGTRLCEDLFGPGEDKEAFYIFDYLGNFEFFRQSPKGKEADEVESLAERCFKLKVRIIKELQEMKYQTTELIPFRNALIEEVVSQIKDLNREQFQVKQKLSFVEKYDNQAAFICLGTIETEELLSNIAHLVPAKTEDENARRFDVLMYKLELAFVVGDAGTQNSVINKIKHIASILEKKATIPQVRAAAGILERVQKTTFWQTATLPDMDFIRIEMRELIQYLKKEMKAKIINVTDSVLFEKEGERFTEETNFETYYQRANRYISENESHIAIHKLKNNILLTDSDWFELERILWSEVGTKEEYDKTVETGVSLGKFVRGITGLSQEVVLDAFSEFLDEAAFNEQQIFFVRNIVDYIADRGTLELEELRDNEYISGGGDLLVLFEDNDDALTGIISTVQSINSKALKLAS